MILEPSYIPALPQHSLGVTQHPLPGAEHEGLNAPNPISFT